MDRWVFILTAILGIALMVLGIIALIRFFSTKEILKFPLDDRLREFEISKKGHYGIYIHGLIFKKYPIEWHPVIEYQTSGQQLKVRSAFFRIQSNDGVRGKQERYAFRIDQPGMYIIKILPGNKHIIDEAIKPILNNLRTIFADTPLKDLFISIRKNNSLLNKILLFLVSFFSFIGIMMTIFSIIFAVNPNEFDRFLAKGNDKQEVALQPKVPSIIDSLTLGIIPVRTSKTQVTVAAEIRNNSSQSIHFLTTSCYGEPYSAIFDTTNYTYNPKVLCNLSTPEIVTIPSGSSHSFVIVLEEKKKRESLEMGFDIYLVKMADIDSLMKVPNLTIHHRPKEMQTIIWSEDTPFH